jgi:hypothetical protein
MSCVQNAGQNCNTNIAVKPSENVAKFKYLGMIPTNENCMHEKIKSRLHSGILVNI